MFLIANDYLTLAWQIDGFFIYLLMSGHQEKHLKPMADNGRHKDKEDRGSQHDVVSSYQAFSRLDTKKRRELARNLEDPKLLAEIIHKDPEQTVRLVAVEKITDVQVLNEIAASAPFYYLRHAAVRKIRDPRVLANIVMHNQHDYYLCKDAIYHITDQDMLASLLEALTDRDMKTAVVRQIQDQTVLADIACCNSDFYVRCDALKKITDEQILIHIARNDSDYYVRAMAVQQIHDQDIIREIALRDADHYVRAQAVSRIYDATILKIIISKDQDFDVRKRALANIKDASLLRDLEKELTDAYILRKIRVSLDNLE